MSSMTSGVKIGLEPSAPRRIWSSAMQPSLQDQPPLGGLEVVVVVELLAAHELLERRRAAQAVDAELALDQLRVGVVPLALDAVDAERAHLAPDVERAVVHRVAQAVPDVAADDLAAALHNEGGHRAGVAEHEDRPALLVDARARADVALDDEVPAADGRAGQRAGVLLDHDDAGHHVLAGRPARAAGDGDLRAVDQAAGEVADAALEADAAAAQDADAERVLGARVAHGDVVHALLVEQAAQLEVDLPDAEVGRVEGRPGAVDLSRARRDGVRLGQPASVVADPALAD